MENDDIAKYIEIYEETYGEVIDRGVAELHLEVLVEFVELMLTEASASKQHNEDENDGRNRRSSKSLR